MGRSKKKSKRRTKAGHHPGVEDEEVKNAPHSIVFHRGKVGRYIRELVTDVRRVMEPYTATHLKVQKRNKLKDLVSISGIMHVTHFVVLTKTELSPFLRIIRAPRGPTLTFKVEKYSLMRDVVSAQKNPSTEALLFSFHPLVVMNNFTGDGMQYKLMATMFQNMFPTISVDKIKLSRVQRCVLLSYNEDGSIDFRHYSIKAAPAGMSRGVKKLLKNKVPNLSKYTDISEFFTRGDLSESEAEIEAEEVVVPQKVKGRGNVEGTKSAIRLKELGPRLTLKLIKIEEGFASGKVLFNEQKQQST